MMKTLSDNMPKLGKMLMLTQMMITKNALILILIKSGVETGFSLIEGKFGYVFLYIKT